MNGKPQTHSQWAHVNIMRYENCRNRLMMRDYTAESAPTLLLQCYKNLYGAEINYLDADTPGDEYNEYGYLMCRRLRLNFAMIIEDVMYNGIRSFDVSRAVMSALSSPAMAGQIDDC